jgi:hypothetical protein
VYTEDEGVKICDSYLVDVRHTNSEAAGDRGGLGPDEGIGTRAFLAFLKGDGDMGRLPLALEVEGEGSATRGLGDAPVPESPSPSGSSPSSSVAPSSLWEEAATPYTTCKKRDR